MNMHALIVHATLAFNQREYEIYIHHLYLILD